MREVDGARGSEDIREGEGTTKGEVRESETIRKGAAATQHVTRQTLY